MRININDLIGDSLDYAVSVCQGIGSIKYNPMGASVSPGYWIWPDGFPPKGGYRKIGKDYSPSTNWGQGGPIIEYEEIQLSSSPQSEGYWCYAGVMGHHLRCSGPTLLIASMRAYVKSKADRCSSFNNVGDFINIPDYFKS